jgi:hypothetical protein
MLQVFFCNIASSQSRKVIQIRDKILSEHGPQRFDAIEEIDTLQLKMEDRISLYMELLNYYIGEATGEVLCEGITAMGDKILPFLVERKNMPVKCEEKYASICYTMEERTRKINKLIGAIKRGIILYSAFPENLKIEVEGSMKIIRIFLKDFKKQKGSFPKDLNVLREYGWKQYGYKLTIVNPWGQPFKYLLKGRDKYILEVGREYPED